GVVVVIGDPPTDRGQLAQAPNMEEISRTKIQLLNRPRKRVTPKEAFARYGLPDIVNTDQGSQFTAGAFTDAVLGRQVRLSMDGKGAWRDNVFVERVWRSIKYEEVYLKAYESVSHAGSVSNFVFKAYDAPQEKICLANPRPHR
ncbi:hypothetical protein GWC77_28270, partial [Paraburkholderia sp. NMBU_R16]|nr:hypothetical protein [Paraburkholderia sp. NMBU_R16]